MCRWSGGTVVGRGRSAPASRRPPPAASASARPRRPETISALRSVGDRLVESASQRHLDLLRLAQQRDRLELEVVVVQRAAGPRQEEAAPAARAGERAAVERAARRARRRSSRTRCGRRAASRRRSPRTSDTPSTSVAGEELGRRRRRGCATPARRCAIGSAIPVTSSSSSTTPSTSMPEQVRRGLLERLPDRQLERRGRRPARLAAALEAQLRDPVLDPEQLDVAAVRLHVRPHACRAPAAPAPRSAPGYRSWIIRRPATTLVLRQLVAGRRRRPARRSARARRRTSARRADAAPRRGSRHAGSSRSSSRPVSSCTRAISCSGSMA